MSLLYIVTASVGQYAWAEKTSTITPAQFAVLGTHERGQHLLQRGGAALHHLPHTGPDEELQASPRHAHGGLYGKKVPSEELLQGGTHRGRGGWVVHGGRGSGMIQKMIVMGERTQMYTLQPVVCQRIIYIVHF
jgi:hypothetical protein